MHILIARILKILLGLFGVYLSFALLTSTLPWALKVPLQSITKEKLRSVSFEGYRPEGPDRIVLVETPEDAMSSRVALLRGAQKSLDIVYHTIAGEGSGAAFLHEIAQAAQRGVAVRIIVDGMVGASGNALHYLRALNELPNAQVKLYNDPQVFTPWKWHALLHDKFIIADGKYMLLGGRNIGDRYFNPKGFSGSVTLDRDVLLWKAHDIHFEASALTQTKSYMDALWSARETSPLPGKGKKAIKKLQGEAERFEAENPHFYQTALPNFLARTLPTKRITLVPNSFATKKKEPWVGYQMQRLASGATKKVILQTPYATANEDFLRTLAEVSRKAEVTMLTNSPSSSPNLPAYSNYRSQRQKFLDTGASIWEYQGPDSIHGKTLIVDDTLSAVGSFNMDDRSFYIDTETMLVIDSQEFAASLTAAVARQQDNALLLSGAQSYAANPEVHETPVGWLKALLLSIVSPFSRLFQFLI